MLSPQSRRNLMEILRPDAGYALDYAVGTSFSLDLLTALTVPLAFTFFGWQADEEPAAADPVQLLDSLHRYEDRLHIFCQAGQIALPSIKQPLLAYLEKSIIDVNPPRPRHVFHPKVWVLRFRTNDAERPDLFYRMLCLSRNLTFAQSWDTALVLDGRPRPDKRPVAASQPLANFVAALPGLAVHPVSTAIQTQVEQLADELRSVEFAPPEGFNRANFYPLGILEEEDWPFDEPFGRFAVVSPFLHPKLLNRLTVHTDESYLVSQLGDLQYATVDSLARFTKVFVLNDAAQPEPEDEEAGQEGVEPTPVEIRHNDLHTKLYVGEAGEHAWLWTGSANATQAAFSGNVEFLVKLTGNKVDHGVDALLGPDGLEPLLLPYTAPDYVAVDEDQKALEQLLDLAREQLRTVPLTGQVDPLDDDLYRISLRASTPLTIPSRVQASCWPITLQVSEAVDLPERLDGAGEVACFTGSFQAITTFFAIQIRTSQGDQSADSTFVLNIPLTGVPADRNSRLLEAILTDRRQLLRLLLLLLAEYVDFDPTLWAEQNGSGRFAKRRSSAPVPLFESMVRALSGRTANLDAVARIVEQLQQTPRGQALLPDNFEEIWTPIWMVHNQLRKEQSNEAH